METTTSFSSARTDSFPAGLRVLVVDDDPTWLKILEKMLKKCYYEVTTCGLAREALNLLRERKDGFDIVISDVNMPDMDGFKLLEHVGLEMDLPVIMMSVDGETSRVMKGVQHGACDYLLKPIRMKELKNIWQHVLRKRIHEVRDTESLDGLMRNGLDQADESYFLNGNDVLLGKKRKDLDDIEYSDSSSLKKSRVVWTVDLHQKFVKAVNQVGLDKVGPKKILDLMGVPWLTRENVASHLQKYRLYLSRLQKDNELANPFGSARNSDFPQRDALRNICLQQNEPNIICDNSGKQKIAQNVDSQVHESLVSIPFAQPMKENVDSMKRRTFNPTFQAPISDVLASIPEQHNTWTSEYSQIQFKQEPNTHPLVNKFNHLPYPRLKNHPQIDYTQPSSSHTSNREHEFKPDFHSFEPVPSPTWSIKSNNLDQFLLNDLDGSTFDSLEKDLLGYSLQGGDFQPINTETLDYIDPELLAAVTPSLYQSLKFDYEHPVIDQTLFII